MGEAHFADGNRFGNVEGFHLIDQGFFIQFTGCSTPEAADEVWVTAGTLLQQLDKCVARLRRQCLHLSSLWVHTYGWRVESLSS